VPARAVLTCPMYLMISAGLAPTPESFSIPVGEIRYRSSLPTDSPTTRSVKDVPYFSIAAVRAEISLFTWVCPPDAHIPRRRDVSSVMAAGMAAIGSDVVPPCYIEE
jgi:hypothetical protein